MFILDLNFTIRQFHLRGFAPAPTPSADIENLTVFWLLHQKVSQNKRLPLMVELLVFMDVMLMVSWSFTETEISGKPSAECPSKRNPTEARNFEEKAPSGMLA